MIAHIHNPETGHVFNEEDVQRTGANSREQAVNPAALSSDALDRVGLANRVRPDIVANVAADTALSSFLNNALQEILTPQPELYVAEGLDPSAKDILNTVANTVEQTAPPAIPENTGMATITATPAGNLRVSPVDGAAIYGVPTGSSVVLLEKHFHSERHGNWYRVNVVLPDGSLMLGDNGQPLEGWMSYTVLNVTKEIPPAVQTADGTTTPAGTQPEIEIEAAPEPPTTSLDNNADTGNSAVVREYSLQEMLQMPEAELPLPRIAFEHPEEDVYPVVNQLPTHVFNLRNGQAVPVAVNNPTFVELASGEYAMRVPGYEGGEIIWKPESGWAVEQFSTSTTRVLLDTGYAFSDNRSRYPDARKDYVYAIRPFDRGSLTGAAASYQADKDYTSIYTNIYATPTPNPLLTESARSIVGEILTPMDAQTLTAFAFFELGVPPTDTQILDVARRYFQSNEQMLVQTPAGEWNLRNGLDLVFAPIAEIENNDRTPSTQFGYRYLAIDENSGRLTITYSGKGVDSWGASVTIPAAVYFTYNLDELTTPEETALQRAGIYLDANGHVNYSLMPYGSRADSGGDITPIIQ